MLLFYIPKEYNWALERCSEIECCMGITLGCSSFAKVANDAGIVVRLTF